MHPSLPSRLLGGGGGGGCKQVFNSIVQSQSTRASSSVVKGRGGTSSSTTKTTTSNGSIHPNLDIHRLLHLRCVGVFAHIDAGKTTVTERMLALAGIVNRAGSVDTGNTVTDYLPAERERGITIQSAAISFPWKWHNRSIVLQHDDHDDDDDDDNDDEVTIQLIDTPGHVDFSVEVNRSVAVLDGAVLVVDSVAGVQAQTETVWRAIARPSMSRRKKQEEEEEEGHGQGQGQKNSCMESRTTRDFHGHEPLACLAFVNKMDKEGCNFGYALKTLRQRLPGANPVAIQIPIFQTETATATATATAGGQRSVNNENGQTDLTLLVDDRFMAVPPSDLTMTSVQSGKFVGIVDLIDMRAVVWPDVASSDVGDVEECIPNVYNLLPIKDENEMEDENVWVGSQQVREVALASRQDLVASLADLDETMEDCFLMERSPSADELRCALRKLTMDRKILPVMAGAALRGKGVEPLLDAIADLLPSPLHRQPPVLLDQGNSSSSTKQRFIENTSKKASKIKFGHPLHPSLLALAFKVIHMKNRGGSGDGRVVFVRIYSGKISTRDTIRVISSNMSGEQGVKPWTERVGGMLELAGGRFDNLKEAVCYSGGVCALIGLKNVSTGDTIVSDSQDTKGKKGRKEQGQIGADYEIVSGNKCLAGVGAPKPVLTVRIEAENGEQQAKLMDALNLLVKEDPSLKVKETESVTLLSGVGELHIEVVVDRLKREFGLSVWTGKPTVAYRETIFEAFETPGMVNFDRTVGTTRMQAQVHLRLEPLEESQSVEDCMILREPIVVLSQHVKEYLGFHADAEERELGQRCEIAQAILSGCKGALKRGPISSNAISNVKCIVQEIDSEGGISSLKSLPGAIRAASSNILMSLLNENKPCCSVLEPNMSIEINVPADMVGTVLSDLTTRRGTVGDVVMAEENDASNKALIYGQVPLAEILGYANNLRSITNGEGVFSAEYKGHSACNQ